jgi:cytoskeletal protein CcmA (bactofilin family)
MDLATSGKRKMTSLADRFGGRKTEGRKSGGPASALGKSQSALSEAVRAVANPASGRSLVSAGLTIKGNLESRGDIEIYGHVTGDVTGRDVLIAADAVVEGSIIADEIEVIGYVSGPITAINVTLRPTARVIGKITHNTMTTDAGAVVQGLQPWQPVQYFTG